MKKTRVLGLAASAVAVVAVANVAAVGASGDDPPRPQRTVTVYSSLPMQGAQRTLTEAMLNGMRLALEESGYRAGTTAVRWNSLDDSTAESGQWDAGQTASNARRAAGDPEAVAYIGEFNSGATAVSMPILNDAALAQVSPGSTAVGLTSDAAGSAPGEPRRYFPTGRRTFMRVVPNDLVQGAALVRLMSEERCDNVMLLNDGELFGAGLARNVTAAARAGHLEVLGNLRIDPRASSYHDVAARVRRSDPACVAFAGAASSNAVQVFRHVSARVPDAKMFGPDAVAESSFADYHEGGIPRRVASRTFVTAPGLKPSAYGAAGQRFFAEYRHRYGTRNPEPYAIYGYEAMHVVLDAIARSGARAGDREAVIEELMDRRERRSVLGAYRINADGDTTLTDYGAYRIKDGALVFDRAIRQSLSD